MSFLLSRGESARFLVWKVARDVLLGRFWSLRSLYYYSSVIA